MGGSQGIASGGWEEAGRIDGREWRDCGWQDGVMDMVIFRTIFFELLVFFTFTLLTLHFTY